MKYIYERLQEYGESHRHPINKRIHWLCVPLILLSLVGLLWSLPVPRQFSETASFLNWGTLFIVVGLLYYLVMSPSIAAGMLLLGTITIATMQWLDGFQRSLWLIWLMIFLLSWIGQFIGHKIEGKKPSFFKDLRFLVIGPAWLLTSIYRRLGIPY